MRWQEYEETAKAQYFNMIEEEEKIPNKGKEEDGQSTKPEESLSPVDVVGQVDDISPVDDVGAKDAGEGAADPTDSFHPQERYDTGVQETGLLDLTSKESNEGDKGFIQSLKEGDVEAEDGSTGRVGSRPIRWRSSRSRRRGWSWMTQIRKTKILKKT